MKRTKTLGQYLAEGDYVAFARFLQSNRVLDVTEADECDFYRNADSRWASSLLNIHEPSISVERVIMLYHPDMISQLDKRWQIHSRNLLWAFNEAPNRVAEMVLKVLREDNKPSVDVEKAMLKRGNLDLFKAWLDKFHHLELDSEALINDDIRLLSLKYYYVDRAISESL